MKRYIAYGLFIQMIGPDDFVVHYIEHIFVAEFKSVAEYKNNGINHEHGNHCQRQSFAWYKQCHCGSYAVAECQSGNDTEEADAVKVENSLEKCGIVIKAA